MNPILVHKMGSASLSLWEPEEIQALLSPKPGVRDET
jgi:hypothetical protein